MLLASAVFLWLGRDGVIKMLRNSLQDTVLELVEGAAIVRSMDPLPGASITIISGARETHVAPPGRYRMEADNVQRTSQLDELDRWAEKRKKSIVTANLARGRVRRRGHRQEHARTGPVVSMPALSGAR